MVSAKWIAAADCPASGSSAFWVRRKFDAETLPESAVLKITADSHYTAWLNDREIGRGPIRGNRDIQFFDEIDIAHWLRRGPNELKIFVYCVGEENFTVNSLAPQVRAELSGFFVTDGQWEGCLAAGWDHDVPYYTPQIGRMECRDLRAPEPPWLPVRTVTPPRDKELRKNPLPPLRQTVFFPETLIGAWECEAPLPEAAALIPEALQTEKFHPLPAERLIARDGKTVISGAAPQKGVRLIWDFGREVSGRAEVRIHAPAGTRVQLSYGETLKNDRVATRFFNEGISANYHFTDCFRLPEGESVIGATGTERGFRLLQVSIRDFYSPVTILEVRGVDRRYPFVRRGTFRSSDPMLDRLWEVSSETLAVCTNDVFMDCPWRERTFWVNDLLVNNMASLHCFGAEKIHRHALESALGTTDPAGLSYATCPPPCPPCSQPIVFAATNLALALIVEDYWMFSGDDAAVREMLPALKRILDAMWQCADADGILCNDGQAGGWNFFDWSFENSGISCSGAKESMLSSLYLIAARKFMRMARALRYDCAEDELNRRLDRTEANLEKRFFNSETGMLTEELKCGGVPTPMSTQLAHALRILSLNDGDPRREKYAAALLDERLLMPELYLHYYWLRAAVETGKAPEALARIRELWGKVIDTGTPTLFEAGVHGFGADAFEGAGSCCHGFAASPVEFLHEVILGVKPLAAGFTRFAFAPQLFDLEFAQGQIPTPHGEIAVGINYRQTELNIPPGCHAILPDGEVLSAGRHTIDGRAGNR
ncbi:MAG: family 78 glycoside hydrolase catalytic domain [Lentisphaeria bacterium]|nr:family 78 glycoside hydrolase catalytic domain [Lentisphaeria bacterium]